MSGTAAEWRSASLPSTVELSPSPDPPSKLIATAGPSRLTTAVARCRSGTYVDEAHHHRTSCEGDLYVVNAMNGERFHLTVALQGPHHPLTSVTHATLQDTVRDTLLPPGASADPPPTLLLDGMPLDGSPTEVLANNAVVVVHRGVSVDAAEAARRPHRSRTPSQPAEGVITVVEMLLESPPTPSAIAPSEREMSLHSVLRRPTAPAEAFGRDERPLPYLMRPRSRSPPGVAAGKGAAGPPSRRLPPRRLGGAAPTRTASAAGLAEATRQTAAAVAAMDAATATSTAAASDRASFPKTSGAEKAASTAPPPPPATTPAPLSHQSLLSSSTEREAFVVRMPVVRPPAKPLDALEDTADSVATVSSPSSVEQMPSARSAHDTQAPVETSVSPNSSHAGSPIKATHGTITLADAAAAAKSHSPSKGGAWDRSKPPPVTVTMPATASAALPIPSPVRPPTSFTSPTEDSIQPPPPPSREPAEVRRTPASTTVSPNTSVLLPSTPLRTPLSRAAGGGTTAARTALFCTPYQTTETSVRSETVRNDAQGTAAFTTALLSTIVDPPPLPPHDSPARPQPEEKWRRLDTRQAAYDAQRNAIVDAAAAEQSRLLTRLQQHCHTLEAEKRSLLASRLDGLRAQEAASRLRTLRAAQEDAATHEIDAVRVRLGSHRDALLDTWLRVVHAHRDTHYAMPHALLRELEEEGERLSLSCLSAIAGYHTQKARLQAVRQQRILKEAEVARLRWEQHVRRCAAEEQRGVLRVVARVRPPLRRAWLPNSVLESAAACDFDRGFAVRVPTPATPPLPSSSSAVLPPPSTCIEVVDPTRDVQRRYTYAAAYDSNSDVPSQQQRLFKEQLQPLLEHMCRTGQRVAVLAFGAVGSGKTYTLVGPPGEAPPPPPKGAAKKKMDGVSGKPSVGIGNRRSASTLTFTSDDEDDNDDPSSAASGGGSGVHLLGVTDVGSRARCGITRCLDPETEATQIRVLRSTQAAEEAARRQCSADRHERDERRWRAEAGMVLEDGLLPRAVAWLTAHLRDNAAASHSAAGAPVVESVVFSMYEVYNDHVYDLLPSSLAAAQKHAADEDDGGRRRVRSDPSTWPRWNAGWLPAPHIKNSNPEKLIELQVELLPTAATATTPTGQPQWRVRANQVEVRSAVDVLQAVELGMQRRRTAATQRSTQSSRSHLFLRLRVEVQRPAAPEKPSAAAAKSVTTANFSAAETGLGDATRPKGYPFLCAALLPSAETPSSPTKAAAAAAVLPTPTPTCVTELLFTDFAGSERVGLSGATGDSLRETQYINTSLSAVADVLAAVARANPSNSAASSAVLNSTKRRAESSTATAAASTAAALVERWGAVVSRPGISLTRSMPVFLQPRFSTLSAGGRYRVSPPLKGGITELGVPLRRRVLSLMDAHVVGPEAAQWWRGWRASSGYIPFRTCKTTQLLQSALGAPCKTLVLACVRPCTVAEVVLPESMQARKGKRTRELALALFDRQAPLMLAEVHSTLTFVDRLNTTARAAEDANQAR